MNGTAPRATTRTWVGLAVLVLPMLLIAIDGVVLIFALADIAEDLEPTGAQQLWILDIYSLMLAGLLITMSSLGDRFGRRKVLLAGAVIFAVASVFGALSSEPWMLIASRALLGVGGAMIMPGTLSLIRNMFLDRDQRRTAMAVWSASGALGAAAGPIVGGWLIEAFTWHAIFLMNIPVMVLLLILAPILVPESRNPNPGRIDPLSIVLSLVGMISFVYGVKTFAEGDEPRIALITFVAGLVLLVLFVIRQLKMPVPMLNVRLFRSRSFAGAVVIDFLSVFALVGAMFALTQFLQLVAGLSIMKSALWMLPQAGMSACAGFIAAALVKRFPTSIIVAIGGAITAGGFSMLLTLSPDTEPWFIAIALALVGLGAGVGMTLTNDIIMSSVRPEESGQAAGISETAYELGTAFGTAILGSVLLGFYRNGLDDKAPSGLPDGVLDSAKETLAAALLHARELPSDIGAALYTAATESFTSALSWTGGIGAAILLAVAIFAAVMLRGVSAQQDLTKDPHGDDSDAGHGPDEADEKLAPTTPPAITDTVEIAPVQRADLAGAATAEPGTMPARASGASLTRREIDEIRAQNASLAAELADLRTDYRAIAGNARLQASGITDPAEFVIERTAPTGARAGRIVLPHGEIVTPAYLPVAGRGAVAGLTPHELTDLGAQALAVDLHELFLQPGPDLIEGAGGIGRVMAWSAPVVGDPGLSTVGPRHATRITDEGIAFRSRVDGSSHHWSPEDPVRLAHRMGCDITFALADPTDPVRTERWARRALAERGWQAADGKDALSLWAVVTGDGDPETRRSAARGLRRIADEDRRAGGLGFGGYRFEGASALSGAIAELEADRPRYLAAVTGPAELLAAIEAGVDLIDGTAPARAAEQGHVFTTDGVLDLTDPALREDFRPLDPNGRRVLGAHRTDGFTRAYVHHLFAANEGLAVTLCTAHNEHFFVALAAAAREAIRNGTYPRFAESVLRGAGGELVS
ncbi:drug resistance transporter, EmrB/QacA subfamily [Tsukamurella pulmonis]|uniref:Drug resistance transporter, EmrB/QacA subfamily n=1 Tax=Tsukamurella pulmonis TaxID=47312 RepID=A0A1H1C539_9ACTN|nr:MFS transporter [Tsukamurella pulmonis]SDQ59305.1 drug resistance transporter, EmrB/QacA subfamily [Tsukamurella pulmonis]SUP24201.1 Antiseptic resistance protein [Tsukamurella pulmonis]